MKILIRNSDNVVIYAQPDLTLGADGTRGDDWFFPHYTSNNCHLAEADLPPQWVGGVWSYTNGTWAIADAGRHAQIVADHAANVQASIVVATQIRLDEFAQSRHYDGILSACTYATSGVLKFAAEGQCCVDARDATWSALYTIMAEVIAGTRAMPESFADVSPLLPALAWPV